MPRFWHACFLLILGLALGLGQPLRALAATPAPAAAMVVAALDEAAMPCHEPGMEQGQSAAAKPDCPHCSHGQSGWGCAHCAGCLLGAALGAPASPANPAAHRGHGPWVAAAAAAPQPTPKQVPTPPPKIGFHRFA